jgi:hypothetical protein
MIATAAPLIIITKAKKIRMAHGMNRLRAFAALNPRAPHTANGSAPDTK